MKVAKVQGLLRGKQPKLDTRQETHLASLYAGGEQTTSELAAQFRVGRSTAYRALERNRERSRSTDVTR